MAYTTINKSTEHFNTVTYTGNSTDNRTVTGVGFQPDWTWIKLRNSVSQHELFDAVRGANKPISSNLTTAESTETNRLKSFDSDGFTLGTGTAVNGGYNFVSWNWKAANSAGSSNSDGSISSTVSANTTAGFSIVKWTGDGTKAATVGHGLGVKPAMIIARDYAQSKHWFVYHQHLTDNYVMTLNSNEEEKTGDNYWGSGSLMKSGSYPTTTTFSFNGSSSSVTNINGNGYANIAYCFVEKTGFSKFGTFTGNGSTNGPFVFCGFKPAWVMIKAVNLASQNWTIFNNGLNTFNEMTNTLQANSNGAEDGNTTYNDVDFVSNGIKITEDNDNVNKSGTKYIYMAFAEAPLVGSNNVPCTAR